MEFKSSACANAKSIPHGPKEETNGLGLRISHVSEPPGAQVPPSLERSNFVGLGSNTAATLSGMGPYPNLLLSSVHTEVIVFAPPVRQGVSRAYQNNMVSALGRTVSWRR